VVIGGMAASQLAEFARVLDMPEILDSVNSLLPR
jgi:hypothetical protein